MANLDPFRSPELRALFIAKYDAVLAGWPVPYEEAEVPTSFGLTHVLVSGPESAPPLVLLHGAASTSVMWRPVIESLSSFYRCYCVDTITDGNKSVATRRVRGAADYVAWLREVFAAFGIENARVAGLSHGGWLAALLAVHAPELVNRLVLLCPAATFTRITTEFMIRVLTSGLLRSQSLVGRNVQWLSSTPGAASDPAFALVVANLLTCRTLRPELPLPTRLADDELRRINVPTTVVIGDREVIYGGGPEAALARAEACIPDVRTRLLPGAGHALTVDAPGALVDELTSALA